jgi:gliding motility-associatede transport system auxiliary component
MMTWLRRFEGTRLALAGLAVAAVLFLAVNVLANTLLRGVQVDLTEGRLFTLSDGTRTLLQSLDEPITLRLYYSPGLGEAAPRYATHYARVLELLERYESVSDGLIRVERLDPQPFSEAEDRAVADGLQGVPINNAGDLGYFGLAGSNSTDGHETIPFFNLEQEPFLEYDLSKLVYRLANPTLPRLGLLNMLPADPRLGQPGAPEMRALDQVREFFDVVELGPDVDAIPEEVGVLLVIDPSRLGQGALGAVDRFVHGGGRALIFVDPHAESVLGPPDAASAGDAQGAVETLLAAWGVRLVADKVAGDLDAARRVSSGAGGPVGDYVAWLSLGPGAFDGADPIMANIERLNLATAGILEPVEGATTTFSPLIRTGERSMAIDLDRVRQMPDIDRLLREYRPEGGPRTLAARITGPARAAFGAAPSAHAAAAPADGKKTPDTGDAAPATPDAAADARPIQVVVVADIDMLYDRFWVTAADFFGESLTIPTANNADFVVNALEALSEGSALIGLRGRGSSYRPFTLIESYRRDAELHHRATEQQLQDRLSELQDQLQGVRHAEQDAGGEVLLSDKDEAAIERFRGEMIGVRRQLREVQHALRSDIEHLQATIKFINIALVPLLLGLAVVVFVVVRRVRGRKPGHGSA